MKAPLSFLREYLNISLPSSELASVLTLAGLEVDAIEAVDGDEIFELSLTPNLGHCLSMRGLARELSAHLNIPFQNKQWTVQERGEGIERAIEVEIQDRKQCVRYACRLVRHVKVGPSPDWLKRKVEACGMRSVNNVVDVGNLVMLELGQPLHMFDYDQMPSKKISVTSHTAHQQMRALDGKEYLISPDALLVCDETSPLAFAGLIGGQISAITDNTTTVLIEAAHFVPEAVRKSSRLLQVKTDSSARFEKGVDPAGVCDALMYAAHLLEKVAGGHVEKGMIDVWSRPVHPKRINCRVKRVNDCLGTQLGVSEIATLLGRLQMKIIEEGAHQLLVEVPTFRMDVNTEIDLVEEVARLYGYNNIPKKIPRQSISTLLNAPIYEMECRVRECLKGLGLQELMTCDLISPEQASASLMHGMKEESLVTVMQAHSVEQSVLRTTLLPGLLQVVAHNIDRSNPDLSGFEVGRVHFKEGDNYIEPTMAAIVLTGKSAPYHFDPKPRESDFFDLKGMVENVLAYFSIPDVRVEISHFHQFHPGRQVRIFSGDHMLGVAGEIHPTYRHSLDIEQRVFFAQLDVHELMATLPHDQPVKPVVAFPGSERDLTVTLEESVPIEQVFTAIKGAHSPLLEKVILLDLYKSSQIGENKKNATLRFLYRDKEKTLSFEIVEAEHARIIQQISQRFKGVL